jgi:polar amino acid transport system substrate-binding protein
VSLKLFRITLVAIAAWITAPVISANLTVGANIGNMPWEFQDSSSDYVGFEIDLAKEIEKRLGLSVKIVNIPFNVLFPAVKSGRIDIAISSITITDKRLRSVAFAQPYYDSAQSLTVLTRNSAKTLNDMSDEIIG